MEMARKPQVIQIGCHQLESPFQNSCGDGHISKQEDDEFESDESDESDEWDSDTFYALYYLRPLCDFSTLLQLDPLELLEDDPARISGSSNPPPGYPPTQRITHRYTHLRHPGIESSGFFICQSLDVLWLSHEIMLESVEELRRFYGTKLDRIQRVIVEEVGLWSDLEKALKVMDLFKGIRTVYVWLESHYFDLDLIPTTESEYLSRTRKLKARDEAAVHGRMWMVEYIDDDSNVYGGLNSSQ